MPNNNSNQLPGFDALQRLQVPIMPIIKSPQEYAFNTLVEQLKQFEEETSDEEVVAAMLASFGQSVIIHIHAIRRAGQFFCLEGVTEDGKKATLMQHYTQTSLLLLKAPKAPTEQKRPIGFVN